MKYTVLASLFLSSLFSFSAFAAPQTLSLTCDARELTYGNRGETGTATVYALTSGEPISEQLLAINVTFNGSVLLSKTSVCGVTIVRPMSCKYRSSGSAPNGDPRAISMGALCNDPKEFKVPNRASLTGTVVLTTDRDHGFFSCTSASGQNSKKIELSNCR